MNASAPSTTPTSRASACCCASTSTCRCRTARSPTSTRIERNRADHHRDRRQGRQGHPAVAFRPAQRARSEGFAASPVAAAVARIVKRPVAFAEDCVGPNAEAAVAAMKHGDILCLENTRFHPDEEKNDPAFASKLARARRHLSSTTPSRSRTARTPRPRRS